MPKGDPKPKLTKRAVDAIRAPTAGEEWHWDSELSGYGVRARSSGVMTYVVQYRIGRRSRRFTVGRVGTMTPDEARAAARRVLSRVADGEDPAQERQDKRSAVTMGDLCDQYLKEHVDVHNRPSTRASARRLTDKIIRPRLKTLPVREVTRQDAMKLHHALRETPRQANHALSILSKMMSLAEYWGYRPQDTNPCRGIRRYVETVRERFLSGDEMSRLGAALDGLEGERAITSDAARAVRLLALTGCRLSEILGLTWDAIDFGASEFILREAKAGARRHPIGAQSLAALANVPRVPGSPYVLHGRKDRDVEGQAVREPLSVHALEHAWRKIKARAELPDVRMHDLRHTVGTVAGGTGANAYLVRDKLGHKTLAMSGRYVNRDAAPLRALSDQVERVIGDAMAASKGDGAEVVALQNRRER